VRKLDGQDDGLLQRLLRTLEACDVVPRDVGALGEDRAREPGAELLCLRIDPVLVVLPTRCMSDCVHVRGEWTTDPFLVAPLAPTAFFVVLLSAAVRWVFSVSARPRYSSILPRIIVLIFSFFSSDGVV
jgi:hypothetical protein